VWNNALPTDTSFGYNSGLDDTVTNGSNNHASSDGSDPRHFFELLLLCAIRTGDG
jgi:hypothetical protein